MMIILLSPLLVSCPDPVPKKGEKGSGEFRPFPWFSRLGGRAPTLQ